MSRGERRLLMPPRLDRRAGPSGGRVEMKRVLVEAGSQKSGCRMARTPQDRAVRDPDGAGRAQEERAVHQADACPEGGRLLRAQLEDELGFVTDVR